MKKYNFLVDELKKELNSIFDIGREYKLVISIFMMTRVTRKITNLKITKSTVDISQNISNPVVNKHKTL